MHVTPTTAAPTTGGHHRPATGRRPSRVLVLAVALVAGPALVLGTATEASAASTPGGGAGPVISGEVVQVREEGGPGTGEQGRLVTAVQDHSTHASTNLRRVGDTAR